jgi:hypothetical protein
MKTSDAIKHYLTQAKLGAALGIKQHSISGWGEHPPALRQLQIEHLTQGKLKASKKIMPKVNRHSDKDSCENAKIQG